MKMSDGKLPIWALAGLGTTQVVGYGTLYYCLSILVPDIARDLAVSEQRVYGMFSVALLIGAFAAPMFGKLADGQQGIRATLRACSGMCRQSK